MRTRIATTVAVAVLALAGACADAPVAEPPPAVVVAAPVAVEKAAPPAVAVPPDADLATLPVVDLLHVVPGLPGTDGLTQRANDDPALGRWQTAVVVRDTAARDAPAGLPVGVVPAMTFEARTTLPVIDQRGRWLRVMVATRSALPSQDVEQVNGRSVWIDSVDTEAAGTDWTIQVDVAAQTLTVDDGTTIHVLPVKATGAPGTPTPHVPAFLLGTRWEQPGTTTPRVLLLSTQSQTIDHYDKPTGTAVTAIHTTTLRGTGAVSNGCVRVTDDVLDLVWQAPAGTVVITVG
ncbi:L,D-transpeptidase [uncultured Cellulomonas sp.]|uniref:L,D-transpeptidase n=1 Tax=uncultured Cellulomonas sp. TaxID=189682 RepID=UPI0028E51EFA|nr:L,D-transpeptidase [uncultured Cellulomonas sp.]